MEAGQVAEHTVGAALERLREQGYDVLYDVRLPGRRRANIDHIAIGPAGVLVVVAKNWSGAVTTHQDRLRHNGARRDKELEGVLQASVDIEALLPPASAPRVVPVLCLAGENQGVPTRCAEVSIVDVSRLTDWVSGLERWLSPAEVGDLAGELRRQLSAASSAVPGQSKRRRAVQERAGDVGDKELVVPAPEPVAPEPVAVAPVEVAPVVVAPEPVAPVTKQWPPMGFSSPEPPRARAFVKIALLLAALLVIAGGAFWWWSANGPDVLSTIFPEAAPSVAAVAPVVPAFESCSKLRAGHPGGIASPGAKNTGRKLSRAVAVTTSQSLYAANARLDSDRDHIACEVVRKRHHKR